jgi:plasmid stability protein
MPSPKRRPGPPRTTGGGDSTLYVRNLPEDLKAWCIDQAIADGRSLSSWVRHQLQTIRAKAEK